VIKDILIQHEKGENRMKALQGHRAVVTGASSGIGQDYARQLAALGCQLVIVARRMDRLTQLADELKTKYQVQIDCIELDLGAPHAAKTLFEKATEQQKDVTILVNNAGVGKYGNFTDFSLEEHLSTLKINATVPTELTYHFVKHMLSHGKKSYIAQVASIAAYQPTGYFTVYSGSKVYLRYFSETLAFELKKSNINMTCICPGGTLTEFFQHSGQKITRSGSLTMMTSQQVVRGSIQAMLKGKFIYIPGLLNKIACFLPRFLPEKLSLYLAFKTMNQAVQKVSPSQTSKLSLTTDKTSH
jgi:short-subunit dehydrogenase